MIFADDWKNSKRLEELQIFNTSKSNIVSESCKNAMLTF